MTSGGGKPTDPILPKAAPSVGRDPAGQLHRTASGAVTGEPHPADGNGR